MRNLLVSLLLICFFSGNAQDGSTKVKSPTITDSIGSQYNLKSIDSLTQDLKQKEWERNNSQSLNAIVEMQKERNAKAKKAAYLRIGFGIAMLIVLVIGWRRRGKKKADVTAGGANPT